ncbi:MAG: dynamin family protein [Solirubrobacterales bacterium]|nr:dynamin family protein [Solirubrobacterales bacterium]
MSATVLAATAGSDYRARRSAVIQLLSRGGTIAAEQRDDDAVAVFRDAELRLLEGDLLVVVCGEFKRGKSTMINALLDEPELLPSDVDITTSVVSTVGWGPTEEITVLLSQPDGTLTAERIERDELARYVTERGNPQNGLGIAEVRIRLPKSQLESGMVIADTPGTGGRNAKHTAAAYDFVRRAAAAVFVWDVGVRLTENELAFLDVIREYASKTVFVLTKIDQDPDFELTLEAERTKLARRLAVEPASLTIIPVSSTGKLRYLEVDDPRDRELSGFPVLEQAVWGTLAKEGGDLMLLRALSELQRGLSGISRPLQAERAVARDVPAAELAVAVEERHQAERRLEQLTGDSPAWLSLLDDLMEDAWHEIELEHRRLFDDTVAQYRAALDSGSAAAAPDTLINELSLGCVRAVGELTTMLGRQADRVHGEVRNSSGLEVVAHLGEVEWTAPESRTPVGRLKTGNLGKAAAFVKEGAIGATVGFHAGGGAASAVITVVAGGIAVTALPIIGAAALAGGILFAGYRGRRALASVRGRDLEVARDRLDEIIVPMLRDAREDARVALVEAHRELLRAMRTEFRSRLTQELKVCRRTIHELTKQRTSREEMNTRAAEIDRVLGGIDQIQSEGDALVAELIRREA